MKQKNDLLLFGFDQEDNSQLEQEFIQACDSMIESASRKIEQAKELLEEAKKLSSDAGIPIIIHINENVFVPESYNKYYDGLSYEQIASVLGYCPARSDDPERQPNRKAWNDSGCTM